MDFGAVLEALIDQMGERHVMLSYQWDSQELVKKVYTAIKEKGVNVWMDIEGGVSGNINEAMAEGVDGAAVVCPFMTQKYQESKNCSKELNYTNDSSIVVVPCMAQTRTDNGNMYRARGWLGIITAGKLWIDFKGEDQMEYRVIQLLTECCNRLNKTEQPVGKMKIMKEAKAEKKKPEVKKKENSFQAKLSAGVLVLPKEQKITIPLKQPLETGDEIEVTGEFKWGNKFNFNLIGSSYEEVLVHFDLRPQENVVVMNNKRHGSWQSEVRDHSVVSAFMNGEMDKNFTLVIRCEKDELTFKINGRDVTPFPIRVPLREGKNLLLQNPANSSDFLWRTLRIPGEKENSSNAKDTLPVKSGEQVLLEESLCEGGGVELWGSHTGGNEYSASLSRGSGEGKEDLVRVLVKPSMNTVYLGDTQVEGAFEELTKRDTFHLKIAFEDEGEARLLINGQDQGERVKLAFPISAVSYVLCEGEPWQRIKLPKPRQAFQSYARYPINQLGVGDVITFTGKHRPGLAATSANINIDDHNRILHVAIRPASSVIVLNTMSGGGWMSEVRAPIPQEMVDCGQFDMFVMVNEDALDIEFSPDGDNGNVFLQMSMPHRLPYNKATEVMFVDFNDDFWCELELQDGSLFAKELTY